VRKLPTTEQQVTEREPRYRSRGQVARILSVSQRTLDTWHEAGLIEYVYLPGANSVRIDLNKLEDMLRSRTDIRE
jgi:predicted site-specific integrase-resolvase